VTDNDTATLPGRRPGGRRAPAGTMTLVEHLRELRNRLLKAIVIVALGTVLGWLWYNHGLLHFLEKPYCQIPADRRYDSGGIGCKLIYTNVLDGFVTRLKIGAIAGIIVTSPLWLYQLWAFITPGLKKNERRYTITFILLSTLLFLGGAALAYLTLAKALDVLTGAAGSGTQALITISSYLGFLTSLLLVFGISFEFPLLISMLNLVGILSFKRLMKSQRIIIFLVFVFAAIATPSQDPFTMCALAVPMCLLFELAVLFAYFHDKRKASESFEDIPDDEASPLDLTPSSIESAGSLDDDPEDR